WSAIAARLPGRTDNEIKNVWHTHLKKRLCKQNQTNPAAEHYAMDISKCETKPTGESNLSKLENQNYVQLSPQHSSSEFSSTLSIESFKTHEDYPAITTDPYLQYPSPMLSTTYGSSVQYTDFWYKLLMEAGELL
ncbi:hypothetical protein MKX01_028986, partial [Papaver californicum]